MIAFADDALAPTDWGGALRTSLAPGTWVERYGKRWFMAQWTESDGRWIAGKLAFEHAADSELWDPVANDVRAIDALGTTVQSVPFVVDLESHRAAFELRSQTVRPGTFQGNMQALLVKASSLPWRVNLEGVTQAPWDEWSAHVERVTRLWITMSRPNPHSPIPEIEELFKKPGVKTAQIVVQGTDVPTDAALVDGGLAHAFDYGKVAAEAVVPGGHKESWRLSEEGSVRKDEAERDASGHVPASELQRLLEERARDEGTSAHSDESQS
jgi:hypothetical protein